MFTSRPTGTTLRRADEIRAALVEPHPGYERFDPEFPVVFRCHQCGKHGFAPRKVMHEALRSHLQEDCPARRSQADAPKEMRLLYPRVKE